jgi:hypothetical protein
MSLSRRISRLESRLDAQRQAAATPGSCRCPDKKCVVEWPSEFVSTVEQSATTESAKRCPKCGGERLVLKVEFDS